MDASSGWVRSLVPLLGEPRVSIGVFAVAALGYLLFACLFGGFAAYDEIAFKSPGRELVQHGRWASPELASFVVSVQPGPDQVYGLQPPLYPLVYAGWTRVFGFGWRQAFAFDALIHVILCAMTALIAHKLLPRSASALAWWMAALLMLVGTRGRPDELAIVLCLSALLLLGMRGWASAIVAGVCLTLSGLASPVGFVCAGCAGLAVVLDPHAECGWREHVRRILLALLVALLLLCGLILLIHLAFPKALQQFLDHARSAREHESVFSRFGWAWTYSKWIMLPPLVMGIASVVLALAMYLENRSIHPILRAAPAWVGLGLALLVFHSPYYLWFAGPFLAILLLRDGLDLWQRGRRIVPMVVAVLAVAGVLAGSSYHLVRAVVLITAPADQQWAQNRNLLRDLVPNSATVLADEHWLSLGDRNRVLDANFSRPEALDQVDFIILTGNGSGQAAMRKQLKPEMELIIARDFTVIHDNLPRRPLTLLGRQITNSAYGMGCVVLKRIVPNQIVPANGS